MAGKKRKMTSPIKQKALLLLLGGVGLSLVRSAGKQKYILKQIGKEWRQIDRQYLYQILHEFYYERLVDYKENRDGTINIIITEQGKKRALVFDYDRLKLSKQSRWSGTWHLVLYDIPEGRKRVRDAFRQKLVELGFYEWQKSVFVYPFSCRDEINFVVEFLEIRPYVRYGELRSPTNEAELKLHFHLT
jgi:hypothetical protein